MTIDLSKLSPGVRMRLLQAIIDISTHEMSMISEYLPDYSPGDAKNNMERWLAATQEVRDQAIKLQRAEVKPK